MRVTLFMLVFSLILVPVLWVTLSGALLVLGGLVYLLFLVILLGYADTAILFFLGAREIKSGDDENYHAAALQEAYKLSVHQPKLYFYNGALERSFVLQNRGNISLVLSRELLEICGREELAAICFELLLQVKKRLAIKRTRTMFIIGFLAWVSHAFTGLLLKLVPAKEVHTAVNWLVNFLLFPWINFLFRILLGGSYFRKLNQLLEEFPLEKELLRKVGTKLRKPREIYSLTSRKWIEMRTLNRSRHFQNITTLEFLPHEWDMIFDFQAGSGA